MIRLGVLGLGAAGQAFLPAIVRHPEISLAVICDMRADAGEEFGAIYRVPNTTDIDTLLATGDLDAVYVGTPTELHLDHARRALAAGKHVLLEKPMALTSADCRSLAELAAGHGLAMVIGHSHSHDLPIRTMRDIIASGRLGRPRLIDTWCFSDWIYRPRRPDELRPELGGGVTFRQGAHQFDVMSALAMAPVRSVKARTFDFDPKRQSIGAHSVTLDFSNRVMGTAVYNGYGYFNSAELTQGIGEWGYPFTAPSTHPRRMLATGSDELAMKRVRARNAIGSDAPAQPHMGLTIVSCEYGVLRQSPSGLLIYDENGCEALDLPIDRSPREFVLDELVEAIAGKPILHDAYHGAAIVEICEAVHRSSLDGREIILPDRSRADRIAARR